MYSITLTPCRPARATTSRRFASLRAEPTPNSGYFGSVVSVGDATTGVGDIIINPNDSAEMLEEVIVVFEAPDMFAAEKAEAERKSQEEAEKAAAEAANNEEYTSDSEDYEYWSEEDWA